MTPYKWKIGPHGCWRIGFGRSDFLIAQGSGFSRSYGMRQFRELENAYLKRRQKKLKIPM